MTQTIVKKIVIEFKKPLTKNDIKFFKKEILEHIYCVKTVKAIHEKNPEKHWRYEFNRYYYEDDKYGYACISKNINTKMFHANISKMKSKDFKKLSEAKKWIESFYTKKGRK